MSPLFGDDGVKSNAALTFGSTGTAEATLTTRDVCADVPPPLTVSVTLYCPAAA